MISLTPLELIVLLAAFGLLCWRAGFHSARWPHTDEQTAQQHLQTRDAFDRIHRHTGRSR